MEVDGPSFCSNKRKCDRHHGWEELKAADFALEDKVLSQRLAEMASRERVLRLRMEELEAQLQARDATATLLAPTKSSSHVTKVEDIS
ncbi:hypothetical protein DL93DRAFT_2080320 [Clavulina sp. PMI_390]|nr:hypothetical protein DL93DRAFT_2080320 [Clavulina sp. PMI_390]